MLGSEASNARTFANALDSATFGNSTNSGGFANATRSGTFGNVYSIREPFSETCDDHRRYDRDAVHQSPFV